MSAFVTIHSPPASYERRGLKWRRRRPAGRKAIRTGAHRVSSEETDWAGDGRAPTQSAPPCLPGSLPLCRAVSTFRVWQSKWSPTHTQPRQPRLAALSGENCGIARRRGGRDCFPVTINHRAGERGRGDREAVAAAPTATSDSRLLLLRCMHLTSLTSPARLFSSNNFRPANCHQRRRRRLEWQRVGS